MAHAVLGKRSAHYGALQFLALTRLRKACTSYSEVISAAAVVVVAVRGGKLAFGAHTYYAQH